MSQAKLNRALFRSAFEMKWRLLAAGLILGFALAQYAGMYSAIESLFGFRDAVYGELKVADLEIKIIPEDNVNIPSLDNIPGVTNVEKRLLLPGNIDLKAGTKLYAGMIAVDLPNQISQLRIQEGNGLDASQPNEVVIERTLAAHHGYKVGDNFRLNIGKDHYDLKVRGIALSPEFMIDSANPNFFLPSKGSLGVVFVPYSLIEPKLGYKLVNSLVFKTAPGENVDSVEKAVLDRLGKKVTVDESTPLKRQFGHLYLNLDLGAFKIFVPAIVLIFVISALVVTLFLMYQWITEKRSEIGVFMSLGYTKSQIVRAFSTPVILIGVIALISGTLISVLLLYGFGMDYAKALGLPKPVLALQPARLIQAYIGLVLILIVSAAIPLRKITNLTPRQAIKGVDDEKKADTKFVNPSLGAIISKSISLRYAIRNLQRGRGVAAMTIIAIALSLGTSLSYFISLTSFKEAIVSKFAKDRWDLAVDFLAPVWTDELKDLKAVNGITRVDPYLRGPAKIRNADKAEPSFVLGIDPASSSHTLRMIDGRAITKNDRNAIVLEKRTADTLGHKVGDDISIEVREKVWKAKLVGVFSGVLPGESYTTLEQAQEWFDMKGQLTGAFLNANGNLSSPDQLYKIERVGRVTDKAHLIHEFVEHLKEIAGIVFLSFFFSLMVAVLFLLSTTSFGVLRRQGEYSMLRTIGFSNGAVSRIVLFEVACVGIIGVAIAAFSGIGISDFLNGVLSKAWFQIDTAVQRKDILIVLIPGLVFLPLTAWPAIKGILKAGLVPSLRKRAFG
ncbi:MAG: ABC transporter permease [Burkholderiales bacterium]|nr:ABC transporter permease [Burkholderiales bacterium]